ncbi:MAG: CRISPR-associated endonuclease Cas1 [bacterium]
MELIINTYGSYLHKSGDCFKIKVEDKVHEISCKKVSSILISTGAYLSTDAIQMAMENNIDIVFLDKFGNPFSRVWHSKLGSTTLIRRKQIEISNSVAGMKYALEWIGNKFKNQIELLKNLRKTRPKKSAEITEYVERLKDLGIKIASLKGKIDDNRQMILSLEAQGSKLYFQLLSSILPSRFQFNGRSRNPAKDEFNTLLNYAYGVLYSKVEKGCIISGLDPFVGIIHTDNYNKKSLVFDLIENYRIWAEEIVVKLFASRKVKNNMFDTIPRGLSLNKEGKEVLLKSFNEYMDISIRHRGRNVKRKNIIQLDCHRIANELIR